MKINDNLKELYIQKGYWSEKSLSDYWDMSVSKYSDREFMIDDRGKRCTYAQVEEQAIIMADYLRCIGIRSQDVVSFQIPNWCEFVIVSVACLKVGAILNPLGMCHETEELLYILNHAGSKVYMCAEKFRGVNYKERIAVIQERVKSILKVVLLEEQASVLAGKSEVDCSYALYEDIMMHHSRLLDQSASVKVSGYDGALILCTSGTTSRNKLVFFTHNNILFSELNFNREMNLTKDDTMFMPAPLAHATGFHHGIISPMLLGAKTVLQQRFNAKTAIELINRERCTYSMGATPFVYDILKELKEGKASLPYLNLYLCGGAPVPEDMVRRAFQYGIKLCEVYGSTESVPHVFVLPDETLALAGTVSGRAMTGVEVKIVDENRVEVPRGTPGEEISRGPNVFVGYFNDQVATDEAIDDEGWYYSGDICIMDEAGYIKVVGRKKDMIVRGGENLNSNAIERDLDGCPHVLDHAVIGMPDERLGERICAYVVLDHADLPIMEILLSYLKSKKVPKRYWPERVEVIDQIPRTASGKVQKYLLKEDLRSRRGKRD